MRNRPHGFDTYLVNVKTLRKIVQIIGACTIYHHLHNDHDLCRILFLEQTNKSSEMNFFAAAFNQYQISKKINAGTLVGPLQE